MRISVLACAVGEQLFLQQARAAAASGRQQRRAAVVRQQAGCRMAPSTLPYYSGQPRGRFAVQQERTGQAWGQTHLGWELQTVDK